MKLTLLSFGGPGAFGVPPVVLPPPTAFRPAVTELAAKIPVGITPDEDSVDDVEFALIVLLLKLKQILMETNKK